MDRQLPKMTLVVSAVLVLLSQTALTAAISVTNNIVLTNVTDSPQTYTVNVTLPIVPLTNPQGSAWAEITLIDLNQDGAASLTGMLSGFQYAAQYNLAETFAFLIPEDISFSDQTPGHTVAASGSVPWQTIADTVTSIGGQWSFNVSAGDQIIAFSEFAVRPIPAPGAIVLGIIGAGLVGSLRKRRVI